MAGPGDVVPHHLRRILSQEQPAGVFHPLGPGPGVADHQAQVLRCDAVDQVDTFVQGVDEYHSAPVVQSTTGQFAPGLVRQQAVQFLFHLFHQGFRGGHQDGGGHRVVFRLGDQVGGTKGGAGRLVGDNDGLRRAENTVDVHLSLDQLLGQTHEQVARPANFVDFRDRLGAVGHCADGWNPSHLVNRIDPGYLRRYQHRRVHGLGAPPRGCEYNFPDSGYSGRDGGHQHRGGVSGGASGGIKPDSVQGPN